MQEPDERLRFVGEGELPVDLQRVNWGAYGFGFIWAFLYGPMPWLLGFMLLVVLPFVVDNATLVWLDTRAVYPEFHRVTRAIAALSFPVLSASYAVFVNRHVWRHEQRRLHAGATDSVPLWRYRKSLRFWTRLFVVVLGVSALVIAANAIVLLRMGASPLGVLAYVTVGLFLYDGWLAFRNRRRSDLTR